MPIMGIAIFVDDNLRAREICDNCHKPLGQGPFLVRVSEGLSVEYAHVDCPLERLRRRLTEKNIVERAAAPREPLFPKWVPLLMFAVLLYLAAFPLWFQCEHYSLLMGVLWGSLAQTVAVYASRWAWDRWLWLRWFSK